MALQYQPTTRSRTGLFLSYRDSRTTSTRFSRQKLSRYAETDTNDDEQDRLIASSNHVALDVDLPPKWVDYSEQVQDILAETRTKIVTLDKLHAKHVLPGFSDRTQEEREIEALTTDITKDFRRCQALIQKVGSESQIHSFPPDPQKTHNQTLATKNVQRSLAAKVQDLSATFRKKQRVYMEKLQGHAIKNQDLLIASGTISLKGSDGMTAVDDDVAAATHTQRQSLSLIQHDPETANLQARDRELSEIAKSISQLAELFKDLSVLVIDQGTLLDSVEYNIEQTAIRMEEAVEELNVAQTYQKNTGRRKCIFLLLLIIFGLIVVLIFKPRRPSSSLPPAASAPSSMSGVSGVGEVDIGVGR
ncbi:t-SNARE [Macrolepiota fuliginosa MF-IS2]|uniref:t-SNARE n=1 Tax=Macrolepiota fuliginosa MF-IS2 TaxID=1400762 RepID=A0A9P6C5F6_9AGAR|nr:t-SNARE [Macrolepiota fuliginosa MF-IS2]